MTQWSTFALSSKTFARSCWRPNAAPRLVASRGEALASLRNLIHDLALRRNDIRRLQVELGQLGLSSLGRCEGYVLAGLEAVLQRVMEAEGTRLPSPLVGSSALEWSDAKARLPLYRLAKEFLENRLNRHRDRPDLRAKGADSGV
jgi:hypothetical protein